MWPAERESAFKRFDTNRPHFSIPVESEDMGWCERTKSFLVAVDRVPKEIRK